MFEYGHGLSYTVFEYEALDVSDDEVGPRDAIGVDVTLSNTGDLTGTETIEVFATDAISSRVTQVRELKRIRRVDLDPGEQKTVSFTLAVEEYGIVRGDGALDVEPGAIELIVGELTEQFEIKRRRPYESL